MCLKSQRIVMVGLVRDERLGSIRVSFGGYDVRNQHNNLELQVEARNGGAREALTEGRVDGYRALSCSYGDRSAE